MPRPLHLRPLSASSSPAKANAPSSIPADKVQSNLPHGAWELSTCVPRSLETRHGSQSTVSSQQLSLTRPDRKIGNFLAEADMSLRCPENQHRLGPFSWHCRNSKAP